MSYETDSELDKLRNENQKAWSEYKETLDEAKNSEDGFSGEQKAKLDRIDDILSANDRAIGHLVQQEKTQSEIDESRREVAEILSKDEKVESDSSEELFRKVANGEVMFSIDDPEKTTVGTRAFVKENGEVRTISMSTDTVPVGLLSEIWRYLSDHSAVRRAGARIIKRKEFSSFKRPRRTGVSTAALISEGGSVGASDPTYSSVQFDPYKYGYLTYYTWEEVKSETVGVIADFVDAAGQALGQATGDIYVTGDGSSKPNGIINAASAGNTALSTDTSTIIGDDLIDWIYSVAPPYRRSSSAAVLMEDATIKAIRKITVPITTSGSQPYAWQPGLDRGEPGTLLGFPVIEEDAFESLGTSSKTLGAFGDWNAFCVVDFGGGVRLDRSDEVGFTTDTVGFRALHSTDSDLMDTNAIKVLTTD